VDDPRKERRARNETSFRTVNEAIADGRPVADAEKPAPFVCECGRLGCTKIVEVKPADYQSVREHPHRFVVAIGHDTPEIERVVAEAEGWAVVEKTGDAASIAEDDAKR
jgi:hypothetical protein